MLKVAKLSLLILAFGIFACEDKTDVTISIKTDNGLQCFDEIKQSVFSIENLPVNIEQEILGYLNREFGAPTYSKMLELNELNYWGESMACGKPVKYWKYCKRSPDCCVAVQPFSNAYIIGMSECQIK